jgi:hypothetical protein
MCEWGRLSVGEVEEENESVLLDGFRFDRIGGRLTGKRLSIESKLDSPLSFPGARQLTIFLRFSDFCSMVSYSLLHEMSILFIISRVKVTTSAERS